MREYLERSFTYDGYISLIDSLLAEGKTTGPMQTAAMYEYGRINRQRMKRLEKTLQITTELKSAVDSLQSPVIWLTITEGWCGDAAQNIPAIELVAAQTELVKTRYILRDENLELMDGFLTLGARSIPKLIVLDAGTLAVKGTWGPRPADAQALYERLKSEDLPKAEIMEQLQRWYNADLGRSAQAELAELLSYSEGESARAAG